MGKKKMKKQVPVPKNPEEAKEFKTQMREADFLTRQAKRKRKLSKIRAIDDDDMNSKGPKQKKVKKSSFDSELVNTSAKSVKAFRHVANKKKNEDRRQSKKNKKMKNKSSFK